LDADVEQTNPIPYEQWALWLPPQGAACTYLGRREQYPETGFVIFTVNKGTYTWQPIIAQLKEQKAPMLKL
jgi:hypothetical protein